MTGAKRRFISIKHAGWQNKATCRRSKSGPEWTNVTDDDNYSCLLTEEDLSSGHDLGADQKLEEKIEFLV